MKSQSNIRFLSILRSYVNVASLVTFGVGLMVMVGWFFGIPALKSFLPGVPAMRFNTALSFLLAGSSLWLLQNEEASHAKKRIGRALAGLVLLICLLTLSEYLFGWNLGIDELFARDLDSPPDLFPGRMSPIAILCAGLSSGGLLMLGSRISQYFSLTVICLSLLAIMNYLFDFQVLNRHPEYTYAGPHASVTFLIVSLAIIVARPTHGMMRMLSSDMPGSKAMRLLLPAIVMLTILMGWLVERAESLGFLDTSKESILLVVLLIFVYSPLIYFIAKNINQAEERIIYLNRLYATLSQVNQTIVRIKSQQELFESICKVAVDFGEFRLAWIGLFDHESGVLTPVAEQGYGQNKLPFQNINAQEAPYKEGLIGVSLQTGQVAFSDDIQTDPNMKYWRDMAIKDGYHSAVAVPIRRGGQVVGLLNLYAADIGFFAVQEEQCLLTEMGADISFALDTMQVETERKRGEEKLILSETRYRRLFESAKDGILILDAETGLIVDVNPFLITLLGYSHEAFLGKNIWELGFFKDIVANKANFLELQQNEYIRYEDLPLETAYGRLIHVEFVSNVYQVDHHKVIQCNIRDITERKRAETQIQGQLQRLNGLRAIDKAISSSFDIRVTLDIVIQQVVSQLGVDAAAILLFNPQRQTIEYAASRGFRSNALHHTHLKLSEGYAGRAVRERLTIHIPDFLEAGGKLAEAMQLAKEDFVDYYGTPLIVKGEIIGVLEIYHRSPLHSDPESLDFLETLAGQAAIAIDNAQLFDNLQRANAQLEQRVARRTEELKQLNIELEHANRAKDEFLATMSHELRTPLNSILGLSETLLEQRRDPLSDYQQKSLQIIEASGRHLLELINDILDLSKIEAGKFDYYPQIIAVDELCRASLAFVKEQATRKFITITYPEETAVSKIYADPRRIKQILVNLLTNAVKFTPEHGQVTLQVYADAEQDRIQFSVIDNGIGIELEDLKQLFVPFVQVDSRLNREYEGTGLGLALVQKLTDLHGGSVDVESEVGKGSRFTINLPLGKEIVAQQEVTESGGEILISKPEGKSNRPSEEPLDRGIVLLAEDNMANTLTIGDYLESHGYQIVVAHDGLEAIEKAREIHPNIILMDIQMPVMDGLEAIRRLRLVPRFASTPIVALTALAMPGDRERCLEAGANEYMSKPASLKTLVKTINQLLTQEE
jgi:PAS domain S-box-containing protein